jgi:hypothetical protein
MPPGPKPGFLPSFKAAEPAPLEVRGQASWAIAEDCRFAGSSGAAGKLSGCRELFGGRVVVQQGLADAVKPLRAQC